MTSNLEKSRRFYEETLGFEPERGGESSVSYKEGGVELKMQRKFSDEELEKFNLSLSDEKGEAVYGVDVGSSEKVESIHEKTKENDVGAAVTEPMKVDWCQKMFLAESPEGYIFEVKC